MVAVAFPVNAFAVTPWQYIILVTVGRSGLETNVKVLGWLLQPLLLAITESVPPIFPVVVEIEFEFILVEIVHVLDGKVHVYDVAPATGSIW